MDNKQKCEKCGYEGKLNSDQEWICEDCQHVEDHINWGRI